MWAALLPLWIKVIPIQSSSVGGIGLKRILVIDFLQGIEIMCINFISC